MNDSALAATVATVALRPPTQVMTLARMGAAHQTRLSFLRSLLRDLKHWRFSRPQWAIDGEGYGHAVYEAQGPEHTYSLVCFSQPLAEGERTDRVIAEKWDTTYVLFDGVPDATEIARLAGNAPRQEAGRFGPRDLVLMRANRSVRLFDRVVAALAAGTQPSPVEVESVGYLMRTTAVYGNGKFGIADRDVIADRPELRGPYRAEMLAVWLSRSFTIDLAEHIARSRAPEKAVALHPLLRRRIGVGNSTGLGMAPYLVKHPALMHRWFLARETALARVRAVPAATLEQQVVMARAVGRASDAIASWQTDDALQQQRTAGLREDLLRLAGELEAGALERPQPWDALYLWAERSLSLEGQEITVSLLLEPHGPLVDDLANAMDADEVATFAIDGAMSLGGLVAAIDRDYLWALAPSYDDRTEQARFWYTSVEKLEPRLGERFEEPGGELEQPLGIGRDVARLRAALTGYPDAETVGRFLMQHPEHRHAVRRVQISAAAPYAEIRENLLSARMRPIDIMRCKLAFFGATRFDPRSDRWVRVTFCQGAPFPEELEKRATDDWAWSSLEDRR